MKKRGKCDCYSGKVLREEKFVSYIFHAVLANDPLPKTLILSHSRKRMEAKRNVRERESASLSLVNSQRFIRNFLNE